MNFDEAIKRYVCRTPTCTTASGAYRDSRSEGHATDFAGAKGEELRANFNYLTVLTTYGEL